jgi:transcription elongation factor Elf1
MAQTLGLKYDTCLRCNKEFSVDKLVKNRSRKRGYNRICKKCHTSDIKKIYFENHEEAKLKKRVRREKNKEKINEKNRKNYYSKLRGYHLKRHFNITLEEYEKMFTEQKGVCAICNEPESVEGRMLAVDHDHNNGNVRALLCYGCNTGLGRFKDDIKMLLKAVDYLKRFN